MTQKISKKASAVSNEPADPVNEICKVWSYVRYFYGQNELAWGAIRQLQNDVNDLRNKKD